EGILHSPLHLRPCRRPALCPVASGPARTTKIWLVVCATLIVSHVTEPPCMSHAAAHRVTCNSLTRVHVTPLSTQCQCNGCAKSVRLGLCRCAPRSRICRDCRISSHRSLHSSLSARIPVFARRRRAT